MTVPLQPVALRLTLQSSARMDRLSERPKALGQLMLRLRSNNLWAAAAQRVPIPVLALIPHPLRRLSTNRVVVSTSAASLIASPAVEELALELTLPAQDAKGHDREYCLQDGRYRCHFWPPNMRR